jgi:ring-1,2-phenylacetyl-CoA epoxidase subunit PaaE
VSGGAVRARPRFHDLTVAAVDPVAADGSAVAVTCHVPPGLRPVFAFAPGQHLTVRITLGGKEIRRSYSLCSTPGDLALRGVLRFGVRTGRDGVFSSYAAQTLAPGDVLAMLPPVGNFGSAFDPSRRRRYGAIVAGSGVTPVLSLASAALAIEPHSTFATLYGNRTMDSAMFTEELADLKNRYPRRFHLVHVFSREEPQLGLRRARLDVATLGTIFSGILAPAAVQEWFLCGPGEMVDSARRTLAGRGADQSSVHFELFHADPRRDRVAVSAAVPGGEGGSARIREVSALLDGRRSTVRVPVGRSVLDAVLPLRPELPYSCRSGVCGTCRARVVDGAVTTAPTWALTAREEAAGYVLTCRSTPATDRVTVDFDVV